MDQATSSETQAQIRDRVLKPLGLLPKHTQSLVMAGLAVVMVLGILVSGRQAPKHNAPEPVTPPAVPSPESNQALIEGYRHRMEENAKALQQEQTKIAAAKQQLGIPPQPSQVAAPPAVSAYRPIETPERDEIEADIRRRNYQSVFAPVMAKSFRSESAASSAAGNSSTVGPSNALAAGELADPYADLNRADGKLYRIFEGSFLETALMNRLDGYFSGPVRCLVTEDLYSHDRQHVLVPKGSQALGEIRKVDNFGQQRLAVSFHRLIMPDGYSVSLDKSPGLNQMGETGLKDQEDHHYAQVFGISIAIGAIAGLAQANTRSGYDVSATDAYRQGVASSLSQSSLRILDRYLNVLPTFTIREGHRIKVYLTQDLLVPAYENHKMPADL